MGLALLCIAQTILLIAGGVTVFRFKRLRVRAQAASHDRRALIWAARAALLAQDAWKLSVYEGALWTELSADALGAIHALMMSPATSFQELDPRRAEALAALHRTASRQGKLSASRGALHRRFHSDPASAAVMSAARGDDFSAGGGASVRQCEPLGEGSPSVAASVRGPAGARRSHSHSHRDVLDVHVPADSAPRAQPEPH